MLLWYTLYMFNVNTLPDITIADGSMGEFSIKKLNWRWYLYKGNNQLMCLSTKTLREYKEQYAFYDLAYGKVLTSGWGFGLAPLWLASKPEVESVDVVEYNPEVVELFLQNNKIPDNVSVIYGDIKTYKPEQKYDCLFLDHFPDYDLTPVFDEVSRIASNIKHDTLWIWSLEERYLMDELGFTANDLRVTPKSFDGVEFYPKWKDYIAKYSPTIPVLDAETVELYIKTYNNRI